MKIDIDWVEPSRWGVIWADPSEYNLESYSADIIIKYFASDGTLLGTGKPHTVVVQASEF